MSTVLSKGPGIPLILHTHWMLQMTNMWVYKLVISQRIAAVHCITHGCAYGSGSVCVCNYLCAFEGRRWRGEGMFVLGCVFVYLNLNLKSYVYLHASAGGTLFWYNTRLWHYSSPCQRSQRPFSRALTCVNLLLACRDSRVLLRTWVGGQAVETCTEKKAIGLIWF